MLRCLAVLAVTVASAEGRAIRLTDNMFLQPAEDRAEIIIGTRGSPLALAQAHETKRRLIEHFPELAAPGAIEIKIIKTTGDARLDIPLSEIGGKGLFTKELDVALANNDVDVCVHSMKDVPTQLMPGTSLPAMLPREDPRDVLIVREGSVSSIQDLPKGAMVGTASLRRAAQVLRLNPDVKVVNLRGNVQTRLSKIRDGSVDATLLAHAGINRLGLDGSIPNAKEVSMEDVLPAIAQGAVGLQVRDDNRKALRYVRALDCPDTHKAVDTERAFLAGLDGSCKTPIAGHAWLDKSKNILHFKGSVLSCDGKEGFEVVMQGTPDEAYEIGAEAARLVRKEAGEEFLEKIRTSLSPANAPGGWDMGPTA